MPGIKPNDFKFCIISWTEDEDGEEFQDIVSGPITKITKENGAKIIEVFDNLKDASDALAKIQKGEFGG